MNIITKNSNVSRVSSIQTKKNATVVVQKIVSIDTGIISPEELEGVNITKNQPASLKNNLTTNKQINGTTACFPGKSFAQALSILPGAKEKFGSVHMSHAQLCPQTMSVASVAHIVELIEQFSHIKLRLHANVRRKNAIELFDGEKDILASDSHQWQSYVKDIKAVNDTLGAPDYSIHAGRRTIAMSQMYSNILKIQDFMKCRVAVEGLYPSIKTPWSLSTFEEYANLLKQDVFFALDLSHVNIMYVQGNNKNLTQWTDLLLTMLEHKNCIEVHLSDNNGVDDIHRPISKESWWWTTFLKAQLQPGCTVFTEGNQLKGANMPPMRAGPRAPFKSSNF